MAAAKRVRWECPNDLHSAVLASTKPPADSIARYCLECSAHKGRLVKRVARSLEKKRAAKNEKAREKQRRKRAKEREMETARYTVGGEDLRKHLKKMVKLPAFGGPNGRMARRPPAMDVQDRKYSSYLGRAWPWENRIYINRNQGGESAIDTLIHELAHIYVGRTNEAHGWHGNEFHKVYRQAYYEYTGKHLPGLGKGRAID